MSKNQPKPVSEACLPWSSEEFSAEYLREWLASRKEAGQKIDPETCEMGSWYADFHDPYGLNHDLPEEERGYIERLKFVRSPTSRGWIESYDLPPETNKALYERAERARQN